MLFENQQSKKSSTKSAIAMLITAFFLITSSEQAKAQTSIKLNAAIDSVLQNNSELKSATLQAFYQKKLIGSSIDIANTSINGLSIIRFIMIILFLLINRLNFQLFTPSKN